MKCKECKECKNARNARNAGFNDIRVFTEEHYDASAEFFKNEFKQLNRKIDNLIIVVQKLKNGDTNFSDIGIQTNPDDIDNDFDVYNKIEACLIYFFVWFFCFDCFAFAFDFTLFHFCVFYN